MAFDESLLLLGVTHAALRDTKRERETVFDTLNNCHKKKRKKKERKRTPLGRRRRRRHRRRCTFYLLSLSLFLYYYKKSETDETRSRVIGLFSLKYCFLCIM